MSADLEGVFDPTQYAPTMGGGQALPVSGPEGYQVVITASEMKQTTSGTGMKLELSLKIMDGPNAGSEGNWNLNIGNSNPTAVKIAQQELACICHAIGQVGAIQSTEPLHNKPFRIVVASQTDRQGNINENGYTEVTKVLRADGSKLTDPPGSAAPAAAAPSPGVAPPTAPAPNPAIPPAAAPPATAATPTPPPAVSNAVAPPAPPAPAAAPPTPVAPVAAQSPAAVAPPQPQPGWPPQPAAQPPAAAQPAAAQPWNEQPTA